MSYNRLMKYNWQQSDWPSFQYDLAEIEDVLFQFVEKTGKASGLLEGLSQSSQQEATIDILISEAIKTSAIEGEHLSREDIKSSVYKKLELVAPNRVVYDKRAEGIVSLMLDVRKTFQEPLSKQKIFMWHKTLFTHANQQNLAIGQWRTHQEPMQVVSGTLGKQKVHFEAPPSRQVEKEMTGFIKWFNQTAPNAERKIKHGAVRSALVHLYFETIHPFEDGNGRIGRALSEKALAQYLNRPVILSLSKAIESNKDAYYENLKMAQRSNRVTAWIKYFVTTLLKAQTDAEHMVEFIIKKAKFFEQYQAQLNPRQLKVIRRMLEEGPKGFEGGMSAKKYMSITGISKAQATRDLAEMSSQGVLQQIGGGRSTHYILVL